MCLFQIVWPFILLASVIVLLLFRMGRRRYVLVAILWLLTGFTYYLSVHGRDFSKVISPDGNKRAWVNHQGIAMLSICIDRGKGKETIPYSSSVETPIIEQLVWIDNALLGVDRSSASYYNGIVDFVIDTDLYFALKDDLDQELARCDKDPNRNAMDLYFQKENEFRSNQQWKREPLASELQYFNNDKKKKVVDQESTAAAEVKTEPNTAVHSDH